VLKLNSEQVLIIPCIKQQINQAPSSTNVMQVPGKQQNSVKTHTLQDSDKEIGHIFFA
jgi:hypothetical protein